MARNEITAKARRPTPPPPQRPAPRNAYFAESGCLIPLLVGTLVIAAVAVSRALPVLLSFSKS